MTQESSLDLYPSGTILLWNPYDQSRYVLVIYCIDIPLTVQDKYLSFFSCLCSLQCISVYLAIISNSFLSFLYCQLVMDELFRETPAGRLIRLASRNRVLLYPEERPDFQIPSGYTQRDASSTLQGDHESEASPNTSSPEDGEKEMDEPRGDIETGLGGNTTEPSPDALQQDILTPGLALQKEASQPITPQKSKDGSILVDWYTTDDAANPQNWSSKKKASTALQIW